MSQPIVFYNTLSRSKEKFKSQQPNQVSLYTCGPTVYNQVHIGNLRAIIFYDVLKRTLVLNDYKVNHVMNLTDIDDKTIKGSTEAGISLKEFTDKYADLFFQDLKKLNIEAATEYPRATDYIPQMVAMIKTLVEKGYAYASEGSVYFDISKFKDYGQLARLDFKNLKTGTRVDVDEYTRDSVNDFVLWKKAKVGEPSWETPWGPGHPGWHIECSVMSQALLGETLDIHAAGVDLIFPHNENEIAQSEAATGKKFVNYWLHNEHLLVEGTKMSKSLGNFYTLADVEAKGFNPLAFRYLVLTAQYRDKLNFTWASMEAAQNALDNLYEQAALMDEPKIGCAGFEEDFERALSDDLNTPAAIAVMWNLVKSDYPSSARLQSLLKMDQVMGLKIKEESDTRRVLPTGAKQLLEQREIVRKNKDFDLSDRLRDELEKLGVVVKDTPEGQVWTVRK